MGVTIVTAAPSTYGLMQTRVICIALLTKLIKHIKTNNTSELVFALNRKRKFPEPSRTF